MAQTNQNSEIYLRDQNSKTKHQQETMNNIAANFKQVKIEIRKFARKMSLCGKPP